MIRSKVFLLALIGCLTLQACDNNIEPTENFSGEHFEYVIYGELSSSSVSAISEELENNYSRIITDLRVQNIPAVTVKIWEDYNRFLDDMEQDIGTRYNGATGYVYGLNEFRLYYNNQITTAAVHEFAHVVSMHVNPSIPNNPRWLWEAVALYETREFIDPRTLPYMVAGNYPTLDELNTDYNSSNHSIYSVGYVLLEYIVETRGMNTVISLIENNGNTDESMSMTAKEFEAGWHEFVEEKYLN